MKKRDLYSARPAKVKKNARSGGVWSVLARGFRRMCMALGVFVLVTMVYFYIAFSAFNQGAAAPALPQDIVLYLKLDEPVYDINPVSGFMNPFSEASPTLSEIVSAIDEGARDPRVKGLYFRLGEGSFNITQAQEVRDAVLRFRENGKFTKIYASSYGDSVSGLARMYFAGAFEERWMQPLGIVSIAGLRAEIPFFRGVLDKIGIEPNFYQRKSYKTAYESFTDTEMSAANRESLIGVVDSIRSVIMRDMPADYGIDAARFEGLVDKGLLTSKEAEAAGLVTHIDYADKLVSGIRQEIQGDPDSVDPLFVTLPHYLHSVQSASHKALEPKFGRKIRAAHKPVVALVHVSGAIVETDSGQGEIAAAEVIAPALFEVALDESVSAVVLRIDSPGGSPVASESILRAVYKVKDEGKPVVVSMGTAAASGGYWVASGADRIFAMPTTMTGSIGVVGGKVSAGELWGKLGVNWDKSIQWGENSGLWSINEPFTPSQAERVNVMLDAVYDAFLDRVAEGRGLTDEQVEAVAQGRVWSGAAALEADLVDELGGLSDALDYAAKLSGVESRHDIQVVMFPKPLTSLELLLRLFSNYGSVVQAMQFQAQMMRLAQPYMLPFMQGVALYGSEPVLTYDPVVNSGRM